MPKSLDINLIRTFVAVADHASMTAAANARYLTQGAISQQIKRLEAMLDCVLFERDWRGLRPTRVGEQLLPRARRLLSLNDEICSEMNSHAVTGTVRLGMASDLIATWAAPIIQGYAGIYPDVEVSLVSGSSTDLLAGLRNGTVDLIVIEEPANNRTGQCLRVENLVWAGVADGVAHQKRPLPISMVDETCAFRSAVLAALQSHNSAWRTLFENGSIDATMAMVRADLAVTAWLPSALPTDLTILAEAVALPELPRFAITLHVRKHGATPAAVEMARIIQDKAGIQAEDTSANIDYETLPP